MGSGEASRCRLIRLAVARQQIPKTRRLPTCARLPYSVSPAAPLPAFWRTCYAAPCVARGWISHPRPFAIDRLDLRHYCGKVFVLATVAVPMASPVTTSSTRRFCCRPSADSFEATG